MIIKLIFNIKNTIRRDLDYRIYVNNDLISERFFEINRAEGRYFTIRESLLVDLPQGEHTIRIEPVHYPETLPDDSVVFTNFLVFQTPIPEAEGKTSFSFYI